MVPDLVSRSLFKMATVLSFDLCTRWPTVILTAIFLRPLGSFLGL